MIVEDVRQVHDRLVRHLRSEVSDRLSAMDADDLGEPGVRRGGEAERAVAARLITEALDDEAKARLDRGDSAGLTEAEEHAITQAVLDALFGLGPLQRYLEDERVTDVHVQGCDRVFVVYADGTKEQVDPIATSDNEVEELIRLAATRMGRTEQPFDAAHPELNLELPDGSRLFAVMSVCRRPSLALRRHLFPKAGLADLIALRTIDEPQAVFLSAAVKARKNIVVSGGTSMGKTTLLRALLNEVPSHERIVTIEDSAELGLDRDEALHPDVVSLEARPANVEGEGEVPLERLVRMALRMDPDRVIVGEVRGEEVLPMLNAMSQGNDGSMCTVHADSSEGVFKKLAMYAIQTPQRLPLEATNLLVANAIDFVVHLSRDVGPSRRGARYLASVREVIDADGPMVVSNQVFEPGPTGRAVAAVPLRTRTLHELAHASGMDADELIGIWGRP